MDKFEIIEYVWKKNRLIHTAAQKKAAMECINRFEKQLLENFNKAMPNEMEIEAIKLQYSTDPQRQLDFIKGIGWFNEVLANALT